MTTTVKTVELREQPADKASAVTPSFPEANISSPLYPETKLFSDDFVKMIPDFIKAQSEIVSPVKNAENPYHKSDYADLRAVTESIMMVAPKNKMGYTQLYSSHNGKLVLVTTLFHVSGAWMKSYCPILMKSQDSQGLGSATTYDARYSLARMFGLYQKDDDGNEASRVQDRVHPMAGKPAYQGGR